MGWPAFFLSNWLHRLIYYSYGSTRSCFQFVAVVHGTDTVSVTIINTYIQNICTELKINASITKTYRHSIQQGLGQWRALILKRQHTNDCSVKYKQDQFHTDQMHTVEIKKLSCLQFKYKLNCGHTHKHTRAHTHTHTHSHTHTCTHTSHTHTHTHTLCKLMLSEYCTYSSSVYIHISLHCQHLLCKTKKQHNPKKTWIIKKLLAHTHGNPVPSQAEPCHVPWTVFALTNGWLVVPLICCRKLNLPILINSYSHHQGIAICKETTCLSLLCLAGQSGPEKSSPVRVLKDVRKDASQQTHTVQYWKHHGPQDWTNNTVLNATTNKKNT